MKQLIVALLLAGSIYAQPSLTTVSGPLANLDGSLYSGRVTFTVPAIKSGTVYVRSAPISVCTTAAAGCPASIVGGILTVSLAANDTVYPNGTPYLVVFQPSKGTPYSENWAVQQSGPYTIDQVKVNVPTGAASINTLLNGLLPPTSGQGNNGDMFLDTFTQCLYGPKSHAVWPGTCVSMVGLTGSTGNTGPTGPPVSFRSAWLIGTAYVTGDAVSFSGSSYIALSGNTGLQPDTNPGSWALLARVGNTGSQGIQGNQGIQGIQGNTGSTGTGTQGIQGIQGIQGVIGTTGPPVTFRNTWLIGTAYVTGDAVSFGGSSYVALSGNTGLRPDINPGSWGLLARLGDTGSAGATGATGGVGATGGTGATGASGATGSTGPAGPAPSGSGNQSLLTPDGTSGTAVLRSLRPADILPAGLLGNSTTGNAQTSTVAAHAGTADLASVATLATTFVCTACTIGQPICWNGSGPTTSCGGSGTLFDSFSGLFDSVSDAFFDSSTN